MKPASFLTLIPSSWKLWIKSNPKKVFVLSVSLMIASFLFSLLQHFFFPPDNLFGAKVYEDSKEVVTISGSKPTTPQVDLKKEHILKEILSFRQKAKNRMLSSKDSLKLNLLIQRYEQLTPSP
ncbi:hypothetical protein [Planobacterium oryzisoli]|uniref:Uncharacterized protein n=1 Tax=Planobacterium oryzisoli TaxID=2771435 RepID=A0A930YV57_9FLAO|nr:hypothetical protein [Planobacterium oryzisoli]MBF5026954.1 hypothetical protein [Planobacterium oryzisoli]